MASQADPQPAVKVTKPDEAIKNMNEQQMKGMMVAQERERSVIATRTFIAIQLRQKPEIVSTRCWSSSVFNILIPSLSFIAIPL